MAAQIADRLTSQEQEIRLLSDEIGRLVDLGTQGTIEVDPSPTLVELRAENEKLKYRVAHLQRSLKEEQERERPEASPGREEEASPGREEEASPGREEEARPGREEEARPGREEEARPQEKEVSCPTEPSPCK